MKRAVVYESITQTKRKTAKRTRKLEMFEYQQKIEQSRVSMPEFKITTVRHTVSTKSAIDFVDLTDEVRSAVTKSGIRNGIVHVFAPHATGILVLTENDYPLLKDIEAFIEKLAPRDEEYNHPSNAHAHLRSMIFPPDKTLPIIDGDVEFGTWQSLFFIETDVYPRKRTIIIQVMGEQ